MYRQCDTKSGRCELVKCSYNQVYDDLMFIFFRIEGQRYMAGVGF